MLPGGCWGRVLEVDLTGGRVKKVSIPENYMTNFVGGSGLGAALVLDRLGERCAKINPLGPENLLVLAAGSLTGTELPATARFAACFLSPLTGIWGESNVGGYFGPELKKAGFDAVIVSGTSPNPVILVIEEGDVYLEEASDLWGRDTYEVDELLAQKYGSGGKRARVLSIGPAGENLVLFASAVHNRGHVLGRAGIGAVMGSKRLKAVVVRGMKKVPAVDEKKVRTVRKRLAEKIKDSFVIEALQAQGTNSSMDMGYILGDVPIKNWSQGTWDGIEKINGTSFLESVQTGTRLCFGCPVGCKREVQVKDRPFAVSKGPGPEYETVASFGTMCLIDNPAAICKLNDLCNRMGMDTITLGATISFAIECFERGYISSRETGGMELCWGDPNLIVELVRMTAKKEGFGSRLALGSKRLAEELPESASRFVAAVKGLESPMHDPRAGHGMGLGYATSIRGACHLAGMYMFVEQGASLYTEMFGETYFGGQTSEGKAEMVKKSQDFGMVAAASVMFCILGGVPFNEQDVVDALSAVTGEEWNLQRVLKAGERIWCLKRVIGNLCGVTAADDSLPERLLTPLKDGGAAGSVLDMKRMLKEYYALRGLDEKGRPSMKKLKELGLVPAAELLYGSEQ